MVLRDGVPTASGQALLKRLNLMTIVRLIKDHPGISRAEVVERSGLTKSTISVLVQELLDEGWLVEGASLVTSDVGRRRTPLSLDGTRIGLLGAEIGVDTLRVVACNLLGEILDARSAPHEPGDPATTARAVAKLLVESHDALIGRRYGVLGMAVGVPGVIEDDGSSVRFAPNLGWQDVALGTLVRTALGRKCRGLSVAVLNDARAAAFSQYVFGAERHLEPLVYLSLGMSIGAGVVVGGRLQVGHNGLAGQVGHVILDPTGRQCSCGRKGCAETVISQRAVSLLVTGKETPVLAVAELTQRLRRGDAAAQEALARAGHHLGVLMLAIGNTLNPAVFVLGGPLAQIGDPFVITAIETMRAELGRFDHHDVAVQICRFGQNACALGAAGSVLQNAITA
jgi:predicted NBD/HSP70 family sugar kinase